MIRILISSLAIVFLAALDLHCEPLPKKTEVEKHDLGINLSAISFWTPEIVFIDAFKQSHPWISQAPGKEWNKGGPLAVNDQGWVQKLGEGQFAETLMFVEFDGRYPGGEYICLYDGAGEVDFAQAGSVTRRSAGRLTVQVTPKNGPIALRLTKTKPADPVRNIRFMPSQFEKTYRDEPFHPAFLKRWAGFKVLRFMDWGMTNNSKVEKWSDRTTLADPSQATEKGVALEYQIQLANALGADPWFNIPHKADDDYVRAFARLVRSKLNPERKIHLEYSNECWHGGFEGGRYCAERGKALGLGGNPYENQLRFYSQRSVEIFKIVEEVLEGKDRLVRILSTQPDSAWAVGVVLDWKNAAKQVDAVAIAPYFGGGLGKPAQAEKTKAMTVEEVLEACKKEIVVNAQRSREIAALVKGRGLKLLAYEGGQHLVGVEGAENDEKLMKLLEAANRSPRMKDLYLQDLKGWEDAGGGLFCVFSSMTRYGKWGSWGVLEHSDQQEADAPKMQAIREWMKGGRR